MESSRLVRFRGLEARFDTTAEAVAVRLVGEIDISVAGELGTWLASIRNDSETLVLDLTQIEFMDSTGLHTLIKLKRELGGLFRLAGASPHVRGLLGVTGLLKFFDLDEGSGSLP